MKKIFLTILSFSLLLLTGCQKQNVNSIKDDLNKDINSLSNLEEFIFPLISCAKNEFK